VSRIAASQSNEVTAWIHWFVGVVVQAQRDAGHQIRFVLRKSRFFQRFETELTERQLKVVRRTTVSNIGVTSGHRFG
jgi:hypothetical protein